MVFGSFEEVVTGDFLETVTGDFIEVVTGEFYEKIGGTFTEIVVGTFTEILMADFYEMREGKYIECNEEHDHAVEEDKSDKIAGNWSVSAGEGMRFFTFGNVTITGEEGITLMCGTSKISITPKGVTIVGPLIQEKAEIKHAIQAVQIQRQSGGQSVETHPLMQDN